MKTVAVVGEGAWGTAMSLHLARQGFCVKLWCYDESVCRTIRSTGINERYLPTVPLPKHIEPVTDMVSLCADVSAIFVSTPVPYMRSVLQQARVAAARDVTWVLLSKGIEQQTLLLPTQILADVLGHTPCIVFVAGPSFAHDVAAQKPTAVIASGNDAHIVNEVCDLLCSDYFRVDRSTDLVGVQLNVALKNAVAIGMGIAAGAGLAANTQALLMTRALHEMAKLCQMMGGKRGTTYGLSGIGDLLLSCSPQARNYQRGMLLGKGASMETFAQEKVILPEGFNTIISVHQLLRKYGVEDELILLRSLYQMVYETKTVHELVTTLMDRPLTVVDD